MGRNVCVAVSMLAVLVFVIGCGGTTTTTVASKPASASTSSTAETSSSAATTGSASSEAEYVQQVSTACTSSRGRIAGLPAITSTSTNEQVANYFEQVVRIEEEAKGQVDAATVPTDKKEAFEKWKGLVEQSIANAKELVQAAKAGETQKVESLVNAVKSRKAGKDAAASEAGLPECAK